MAAPKLAIAVEPLENGKAEYLVTAAPTKSEQALTRVVLRLRITNNESVKVVVSGIKFSFPASGVGAFTMQGVPLVLDPDGPTKPAVAQGAIQPGKTATWSNGVVKLNEDTTIRNDVFLPPPVPANVTVSVTCSGFASPATRTLPLAPHKSPTPAGAYLFPFSAVDLRIGEYIVTSALHWANGGAGGTQIFAHDIGCEGFDPSTGKWSETLPGKSGTKNQDYRIWGKPLRAVADGTIESWFDGMDANTVLGQFPDPTPDPGTGNHVWVRHGNEVVVYCHMQKGTIPAALMTKGAPVKAGQRLGLAGNSGNSTNPHTHVQCQKDSSGGPLRPLPFTSAWVITRTAFTPPNPSGPWVQLKGQGIPKTRVAIWPAASKPAWYPPGWGEIAHFGIAEAEYQTIFERVTSSGYRPIWVDGYDVNAKAFFNAIFRPADGTGWIARHGLTGDQYQAEFNTQRKAGLRLMNLNSYLSGGALRYAAIFVKAAGPAWRAYHGRTADEHQALFDDWTAEGFRPVNVTVVSRLGQRSYTAFYVSADVGGFRLKSFLTPEEYQTEWTTNTAAGRQLAYLGAYSHMGSPRFSAIFQQKAAGSGATLGRHHLTSAAMQMEYDKSLGKGLLTRALTGYELHDRHQFAAAWRKS